MNVEQAAPASLARSFLIFAGAYVLASAAVLLITSLLHFNPPSAMGIIILVAVTGPVMQAFVSAEGRTMTVRERLIFALGATLIALVLSLLILAAMLVYYGAPLSLESLKVMIGINEPINGMLFLLIGAVALIVPFLVIYFVSGFMGRNALKQRLKRLGG
jgi:uncharacterized membrane protein